MDKVCPKCEGTEAIRVSGFYVNNVFLPYINHGLPSTKYVCANCGNVLGEQISPKDIEKYSAKEQVDLDKVKISEI